MGKEMSNWLSKNCFDKKDEGVFKYKYFSETVSIYKFLTGKYEKVYFSEYLYTPCVCVEIGEKKFTFYVKDNSYFNNEKWLYLNWDTIKGTSGGGYGRKAENIQDLITEFIKERLPVEEKQAYKQVSIFDFI